MDIVKKEIKTETIRQDYDYTFLADLLEMVRGYCCFIQSDKNLNKLFTAVINYVDSCMPDIDSEIIGYDVSVMVKS